MTCWLPVPRCRPFASTSSADSFRMSLTRSFLLFAPFESALPAIMSVSQTSSIASGRLCTSMWCLLTSSCTSQVTIFPVTLALPWRKTCRAFALSCILSLDSPRIAVQSCPFFLWHGHVLLGYGSAFRCIVPCGVWFVSLLMSVELSCLCLFSGVFSSSCSAAVLLSASRLCSLSRRVFRASGRVFFKFHVHFIASLVCL